MVWFLSSIFDWSFVSKSFLVSVYESCSWFPTINPKNDPRLNHFLRGRPQAINRTLLPFLWKDLFINNIEHIYTHTHIHIHAHLYTVSSPLTVRIQSGVRGCALSARSEVQWEDCEFREKGTWSRKGSFFSCLSSMLKLLVYFVYINTASAGLVHIKMFKGTTRDLKSQTFRLLNQLSNVLYWFWNIAGLQCSSTWGKVLHYLWNHIYLNNTSSGL